MKTSKHSQSQNFPESLKDHEPEAPLSPGAQRLKDRLSQIPFYAKRAQGSNGYWKALHSSHINLYPDEEK